MQAQGLLARWFRFQPGEIDSLDTDDLEMWLEQAEEQIKSEFGAAVLHGSQTFSFRFSAFRG